MFAGWRYAELDRAVKDKDSVVVKLREAAEEREGRLNAEIRSLTAKMEESSIGTRQLEWMVEDLQKDKASMMER